MPELTQERVQKLFKYDSETGLLTWKKRKFNSMEMGDVAGILSDEGYYQVRINKEIYPVHQIIWLLIYGYLPDKIKHINHKRFDNYLSNLKEIPQKVKVKKRKLSSNNSSGVTGVYFDRNAGQWQAQIYVEGKTISLGYFENFDEAIAAREQAETKYGLYQNEESARGLHPLTNPVKSGIL